jgi:hypothetical protein
MNKRRLELLFTLLGEILLSLSLLEGNYNEDETTKELHLHERRNNKSNIIIQYK